jgi:hypothetical protein
MGTTGNTSRFSFKNLREKYPYIFVHPSHQTLACMPSLSVSNNSHFYKSLTPYFQYSFVEFRPLSIFNMFKLFYAPANNHPATINCGSIPDLVFFIRDLEANQNTSFQQSIDRASFIGYYIQKGKVQSHGSSVIP